MDWRDSVTSADRQVFGALIDKTRACMGSSDRKTDWALECETAYLSNNKHFTYHTHPNGTPYPSDIDKKTTSRLKKSYLIIGLVPTREVVVYSAKDGFSKLVGKFRV